MSNLSRIKTPHVVIMHTQFIAIAMSQVMKIIQFVTVFEKISVQILLRDKEIMSKFHRVS